MRRLCLYCLIGLPIFAYAETSEIAPIPAPPEMSPESKSGAVSPESQSEQSIPPVATPEPPDIPTPVQSGENLEPDITIVRRGQDTIQEYRSNGVLYMVKVVPDIGPAYYMIDTNNDGKLDVQRSDLDRGLTVNLWKLFEWK